MKLKSLVLAVTFATASASSFAALNQPVTFSSSGPGIWTSNLFSSTDSYSTYKLDFTGVSSSVNMLTSFVVSVVDQADFDITNVRLDGTSFADLGNQWTYNFSGFIGTGLVHTLEVSGTPAVGTHGYSGSITVAVPEPESYAMMIAGLGAMGFMARRRRNNG
jgi:PEP-CTERM motif